MSTTRDGILTLLDPTKDISLLDVVRSEHFQPAIRNLVPELIDFLFSKKVIRQIFSILLTKKSFKEIIFEENPFYISISLENQEAEPSEQQIRLIEDVFSKLITTNIDIIQSSLCTNDAVCDYINEFISHPTVSTDCKISGLFTKILRQLIYSTEGSYIQKIPNLFQFLLQRINILSYSKLLKSTVRKFSSKFLVPIDEIIDKIIIESLNPHKTLFCLTLIQSLFKKSDYIKTFIEPVAKINNIQILLSIASGFNNNQSKILIHNSTFHSKITENLQNKLFLWPNRLSIIRSLTILQIIYKNISQISDFIQRHQILSLILSSQSHFPSFIDPHDYCQAMLLTLYPHRLKLKMIENRSLFSHFLLGQTSTFVSNSIIDHIREMDDSSFHNFVEDKGLSIVNNVIQHCTSSKSKINGHIFELAKILNERKHISRVFQTPEWMKFTEKYLNPHIEMLNVVFKYDTISDDSDTDKNSEIFVDNFDFVNPYISSASQPNPACQSQPLPTFFSESHHKMLTVIGSNAFSRQADAYKNSDEYSGSASESDDDIIPEISLGPIVSSQQIPNDDDDSSLSSEETNEPLEQSEDMKKTELYSCNKLNSPSRPLEFSPFNRNIEEIYETNSVIESQNPILYSTSEEESDQQFSISDDTDYDENSKSSSSTSSSSCLKKKKNISMSWDPRYLTTSWGIDTSSDSNSDKLENAELQQIKVKTTKKRLNTHSESFDHGCANGKNDIQFHQEKVSPLSNKVNNVTVPAFGLNSSPLPSLKMRRSRRHPHENASISDVPASIRKLEA